MAVLGSEGVAHILIDLQASVNQYAKLSAREPGTPRLDHHLSDCRENLYR